MSQIVCFDPRSIVPCGAIVEDTQAPRLKAQGVALLPVDANRHFSGPAAGHAARYLGEGWRYDRNQPDTGCQLFLAISRETPALYWCARLHPIEPTNPVSGRFKLIADSSSGQLSGGIRPLERVESLPTLDKHGGCYIYGKSALAVSIDGVAALALHGIASNVRCVAFAVSAVRE